MANLLVKFSIAYEVFSMAEKNESTNPNINLDTDKFRQEMRHVWVFFK